jgi:hypothetical protein
MKLSVFAAIGRTVEGGAGPCVMDGRRADLRSEATAGPVMMG